MSAKSRIGVGALVTMACFVAGARAADKDVVRAIEALTNGGGYENDPQRAGAPKEIKLKGVSICDAPVSGKTKCTGVTLYTAIKVADARGLLKHTTTEQIKRFRNRWFVATEPVDEKGCVAALDGLGIGDQVQLEDAEPGDFLQFWRTKSGYSNGHSAVFLGWAKRGGNNVGIRYRSSQASTNGVGTKIEYFLPAGDEKVTVEPNRIYVGRLKKAP